MRLLLLLVSLLSACSQGSVNWFNYATEAQRAGLLRQERMPADAPYTNADLIDAFEKIAFRFEVDPFGTGEFSSQTRPEIIRKVVGGPSILVLNANGRDRAQLVNKLRRYTARLSELTGLTPRVFTDTDAYREARQGQTAVLLLQATEEEFALLSDPNTEVNPLKQLGERADWFVSAIERWRFSRSPCGGQILVSTQSESTRARGEVLFVFLMFRNPLPDILLDGCVEEEMAQVLGLFNDHPSLRPSIFNDDEEFSRLTSHDADLLRLLYHPSITPGMTKPEAMAIITELIENGELGAGG